MTTSDGGTDAARGEELKAIQEAFPSTSERLEFLYGSLSIVDGKAASLLSFNGIGLAALAVWLGYIQPNWFHLSLDFVFVLLLISCIICLNTVRVYWSPAEHFQQSALQMELLKRRDSRTRQYRMSWWLSGVGVALLTVFSLVHTIETYLLASGRCGEVCHSIFADTNWGSQAKQEPAR